MHFWLVINNEFCFYDLNINRKLSYRREIIYDSRLHWQSKYLRPNMWCSLTLVPIIVFPNGKLPIANYINVHVILWQAFIFCSRLHFPKWLVLHALLNVSLIFLPFMWWCGRMCLAHPLHNNCVDLCDCFNSMAEMMS